MFEAPSHPGDTRKEGGPRFQGNPKKSKVSSGKSGLRLHGPRCRSVPPRREKPDMLLYRYILMLVPRLNLNINHETRPPRSGRPQAPPNIRAAKLSVWGLPGELSERGVEFIFGAFGVVENVTMFCDEVYLVTMGGRDQADVAINRLNGKRVEGITIRAERVERHPKFRPSAYDDEGRPWDLKTQANRHNLSRHR